MKLSHQWISTLLIFLLTALSANASGNSAKADATPDLFDKFRIEPRTFRVAKCPKAINEACIKWKIGSRQNSQDSARVLNVTTMDKSNTQDIFKEFRITMSDEICTRFRQNNETLASCNYTLPLEECRNYLLRLGPDANSGGVTTVPIKPSSMKVELTEIANNRANLSVHVGIECENDYLSYVDYDLFDKSTNQRKSDVLNAVCEENTCTATLTDVKGIYFCRQYSFRIDMNNIKDFSTPPDISNVHLVKFEGKTAFLKWTINPPECRLNIMPLIEMMYDNTTSAKERNRQQNLTCTKGSCSFEFETESCVNYVVYPNRLKSKSISVLRPSIFNVSAEISQAEEGQVILSWVTGCQHNQKVFTAILKNEFQNDVVKQELNATCTQNMRCYAAIHSSLLLPCTRYQIQIDDSSGAAAIETPLRGLDSIRANATALYNEKSSLTLTAVFSDIQGNCAKHLADATFKILANPPIESSLRCSQVIYDLSSVECIGQIINNRIVPPCGPTVPMEINANFVGRRNEFKHSPRLNITLFTRVADDLKIDTTINNLVVKLNGENLAMEWDDSSKCPASTHPPIKLTFLPHNREIVNGQQEISVPATCFKYSDNMASSALWILGHSRVACANDAEKEYDINLLPCTTYNLSFSIDGVQKRKTVQFATFLNDETLKKVRSSISAKPNTQNGQIALNVSLHGVDENCARQTVELEIALKSKEQGDYAKNLSCAPGERSSITCAGDVSPLGLDICESHALHLRALHRTLPVSSWHLNTTHVVSPLANRADDYDPFIRVLNTNDSIAAEIEWSDPGCVLMKIDFWDVVLSNGTHEQRLQVQRPKFHVIAQNTTGSHQYKIATNNADLRVTIQNVLTSHEATSDGFQLAPCSNYTVNFVPNAEDSDLLAISGVVKVAHFNTGLNNAIVMELGNITSDNADILISYPKRCLDNGLVPKAPLAKIDGNSAQPSLQYSDETCNDDMCFTRWQPGVLAPCTKYKVVVAGAVAQAFTTAPDSPRNLSRTVHDSNWIFKWDPPFCAKTIVYWRFEMRVEERVIVDEAISQPTSRTFVLQPDEFFSETNESCLNFSYRLAAVWSGNATTWSNATSFSECLLANETFAAEIDLDESTATEVESTDKPVDLSQPTTSSELGGKNSIPWVLLLAAVSVGFLLLASLVVMIVYMPRRKKKEVQKKRKISETGLWMTTELNE